ncbi:MAG TPA: hypothetical protein VF754_07695, partial [Pyrinomonadaceae bacterium]
MAATERKQLTESSERDEASVATTTTAPAHTPLALAPARRLPGSHLENVETEGDGAAAFASAEVR